MPPKNCELGPGNVFWLGYDRETRYEIPKLTLADFEETDEEQPCVPIIRGDCEAELVCTTKINRKVLLRVILGISNNWLKMHGYPMLRKTR